MPTAFLLSVRQLGDPAIRRLLGLSLLITLALFGGLGWAIHAGLQSIDGCRTIMGVAICPGAIGLSTAGTVLLVALALWLLFPAVAMGVVSLFSDRIVEAVERRHYPQAAASARAPGWGRTLRMAAASAGRLIGYNLLASPFYLLLLVTGVGPFLLALAVNGIAIGRDLWEMVAARHLPSAAMPAELVDRRVARMLAGLATAGLFVVPVVNLLAPMIGAAMATHLFHRGRQ